MIWDLNRVIRTVRQANGLVVKYDLFGVPSFQKALRTKKRRVLFRTGKYGLKAYKRTVGKKRPKAPPKFTKTGKISKRFLNYQARLKKPRPPYYVRGQLKGNSAYEVDVSAASVLIGPYKLPKTGTTRTRKTIPRLLEEGGTASIMIGARQRTGTLRRKSVGRRRVRARYRPYPFLKIVRDKTAPQFLKIIKDTPL